MPSITAATCHPLLRGDPSTTQYRLALARHQVHFPFRKSRHLKDQAHPAAMPGGVVQVRTQLHQLVESWTRRPRVDTVR